MLEIELLKEHLYIFGLVYLLIEVTGIYYAFHAILNTRTSQAAIAWALTLVTMPILVLPLYWIFGSTRFHGYMESFRQARVDHDDKVKQVFEEIQRYHVDAIEGLEDVNRTVTRLDVLPFTSHNSAQLLINGQKTYDAMLEAIEQAQDYVLLQFYIIHNDHVGETFRQLLTKKLQQGVQVYFLYDEIGSHRLSKKYQQELRAAGARVSSFNGHKGINKYLHINFRNHRKILIVDGLKAFVGGLNLGREYLGEDEEMGYWRDTHVMLQGPSVQTTQTVFVKDWFWSEGEVLDLNWRVQTAAERCPDSQSAQCQQNIMVLDTGPADDKPVCSLFFCALINQARCRVWIATPYFIPDQEIIQALKNAALRGVDVRLILPDSYDKYFVYIASFAYYRELQGYDINIYRYTKGFSHQKVIMVDDRLAGIGTVNLDNRSIYLNFEVNAYIADAGFATQVREMLEYDMEHCFIDKIEAFEQRPFWFKAVSRLVYLFSPVL